MLSILILGLGALGNFQDRGVIDFGEGFRDPPESVDGQALIEESLSAGQIAPTTILVEPEASEPVAKAVGSIEGVEAVLRGVAEREGVKPKLVFQPLRVALAGTTVSSGIFETVALLGRDETLARVDDALDGRQAA